MGPCAVVTNGYYFHPANTPLLSQTKGLSRYTPVSNKYYFCVMQNAIMPVQELNQPAILNFEGSAHGHH